MVDDTLSLYSQAKEAVGYFDLFFKKHNLTGLALADHLCYKCSSAEEFERVRASLEHASDYIHQAMISDRRIAYIKLSTPVPTTLGEVHFLELSDQKPDGSQKSGFDHIELYPTGDATYESLLEQLRKKDEHIIHVERPHHTTDDVVLPSGLLVRFEPEPLIEKIKRTEL